MLTPDEIKDLIWFACLSVGLTIIAVRFAFAFIRSMEE